MAQADPRAVHRFWCLAKGVQVQVKIILKIPGLLFFQRILQSEIFFGKLAYYLNGTSHSEQIR